MKVYNINKFFALLVIIFSIFLYSCGDKDIPRSSLELKDNLLYKRGSNIPFTGRERALVDHKIIEYDVKDGLKHGEFRIFSEEGKLEMQGQVDSNRNVGKWFYYFTNGQVESEGFFVNDKPEGLWVWNYPDGKRREEGNYQDGVRVGMWYQYDNNGEIVSEKNYDIVDTLNTEKDSIYYFNK